jgi:hypothetical protein
MQFFLSGFRVVFSILILPCPLALHSGHHPAVPAKFTDRKEDI